ncbi:MFS general substrate transporter [Auriculariales sp. MPI-PUGE-AT-0066]|nr:MFS general substrate transporter [Auriculariales sp. MPI-PUGE-AT-0066]
MDSDSVKIHNEKATTRETVIDPNDEFGGLEARQTLEKKMLRKVDLRMTILILENQFPTLRSSLRFALPNYVGYILCQVSFGLWLPFCMAIWGTISCLTGITHNFVGALLTRFFLGFVEAAFFPGALFLLSKWYTRRELGLRTTILYCGNLISNATGNLIASGVLTNMQGTLGHAAWVRGITIAVAILMAFVLPDFPENSRFLSPIERRLAQVRMEEDAGAKDTGENEGTLRGFVLAVTDWQVWFLAFALTAQVVALSFNAYFQTLTATLGYSTTVTLLLCAPPWVFATIVAFLLSRSSDKHNERCFHIIASILVANVGFIISLATQNTGARFFALCDLPPRPPAKRAVALALINAFSQLGNVSGSYVWPKHWGPTYRKSYGICIACSGTAIIMCLIFRWHLARQNHKIQQDDERRDPSEKRTVLFTL